MGDTQLSLSGRIEGIIVSYIEKLVAPRVTSRPTLMLVCHHCSRHLCKRWSWNVYVWFSSKVAWTKRRERMLQRLLEPWLKTSWPNELADTIVVVYCWFYTKISLLIESKIICVESRFCCVLSSAAHLGSHLCHLTNSRKALYREGKVHILNNHFVRESNEIASFCSLNPFPCRKSIITSSTSSKTKLNSMA